MQKFNVQSKTNRKQISLLLTNRTKRFMGKTNKQSIEQSRVREGSPMDGGGSTVGRISGKRKF